MSVPPPYVLVEAKGALAFSLPELQGWVESALQEDTLYDSALATVEIELVGRGPIPVVQLGGRRRAVRHYRRGGAVASALGDRYLRVGAPRPWRELQASEQARRAGLPTPRVAAGAVYPSGFFYRADLVIDYEDALDLATVLFAPETDSSGQAHLLRGARRLALRVAELGMYHPDLNAKNILVRGGRAEDLLLIDLDRFRAPQEVTGHPDARGARMLGRLARSLRKFERSGGRSLTPDAWEALRGTAKEDA